MEREGEAGLGRSGRYPRLLFVQESSSPMCRQPASFLQLSSQVGLERSPLLLRGLGWLEGEELDPRAALHRLCCAYTGYASVTLRESLCCTREVC